MDCIWIMMEVERKPEGWEGSFATEQKGCGFMLIYPVIDVQETGKQLKRECERRKVTPREIQDFLGLAALQSIYNWFQGRALPSLDNFYALSCYLGTRMEELVVPRHRSREVLVRDACRARERRMMAYFGFWLQAEAAAALS
ncbi:MAG: helix-turn-helix transcriptional regulator [Eubacteriales bacterium]|nr:helix-turn-helix transcriptional regulator [Eubacteriales bacterium]